MAFSLTFETEGAAFADGQEHEVARILEHVLNQVREGYTSSPCLHDSNGQGVGSWEMDLPRPREEDED